MRTPRTAAFLAGLVCAPLLAGCLLIAEEPPMTVRIPPLSAGESWTIDAGDSTESGRVGSSLEWHPDAFGIPVQAWVIDRTFTRHDLNWSRQDVIEAGTGAWLVNSHDVDVAGYRCTARDVVGQGYRFSWDPGADTYPVYMLASAPHDAGTLWGRTLRDGDVVETTHRIETDGTEVTWHVRFTALGRAQIESPIFPDAGLVPTLVVERRTALSYAGAPEPAEDAWSVRDLLYFADGVRLPLQVRDPPETDGGEVTAILTRHDPGTGSLPLSGQLETHQFEGRHPAAAYGPLAPAPITDTLDLAFPLDEALAAALTDPRAAANTAWRATHADAYIFEAEYNRQEPGHPTWRLIFTDGEESSHLQVSRTIGPGGVPVDEAVASPFGASTSAYALKPGALARWDVIDAASALHTAAAFDPRAAEWDVMTWSLNPFPRHLRDDSGPTLTYAFHTLNHTRMDGPSPAQEGHAFMAWPSRLIDGATGRLAGGTGSYRDCVGHPLVSAPWM